MELLFCWNLPPSGDRWTLATLTRRSLKALKWINGPQTDTKPDRVQYTAQSLVIPIYAAKYLKESLECVKNTRDVDAVVAAAASTSPAGADYISGTKAVRDNCAYSPQLRGFVHADLLEKKPKRTLLREWWGGFVRAANAANAASNAATDADFKAFGVSTAQASANRKASKDSLRIARLTAMLRQAGAQAGAGVGMAGRGHDDDGGGRRGGHVLLRSVGRAG